MAKKNYQYKFAERFDSYERLHTFTDVDHLMDILKEQEKKTFSVLLVCGTDERSLYKSYCYIIEKSSYCFYLESGDAQNKFLNLIEKLSDFLLIWDQETFQYVNRLNPSIKLIPISLMLKKAFIRLNSVIIPNEQNFINFLIEISNIPVQKNTTLFWNTYVPYTSLGIINIADNSHQLDDSLMKSCVNGKNLFKNAGELPDYFFKKDKPLFKKMDINQYPDYLMNSDWIKRITNEESEIGVNLLSSICQLKLALNIGSMMKHGNVILIDFFNNEDVDDMMWFLILELSIIYISLNSEKKRILNHITNRRSNKQREDHKNMEDAYDSLLKNEEHVKVLQDRFYQEYVEGDKKYDKILFEETCLKLNYDIEYINILTNGEFLLDLQKNSHMNLKNVISIFYHESQRVIGLLY